MTLTYNWLFPTLTAYPTQGEHTNVVFTVHWRLQGIDEEGRIAEVYGATPCTYVEGTPFTPFEELTKEIVTGWVEGTLGEETIAAYKNSIMNQIQEQITPSQVNLSPPW